MIRLKLMMPLLISLIVATNVAALDVKFSDKAWESAMVPAGQQCQKFGGNDPATPELMVTDIPAGSNAIIMEYSDRDSEKMNNGGHGIIRYALSSSATQVTIPSVLGHTFDIPSAFTVIEEHRSPGWDKAGAYMPPCSGGKSHAYYLTVKAVKGDNLLAETVIEMGKY